MCYDEDLQRYLYSEADRKLCSPGYEVSFVDPAPLSPIYGKSLLMNDTPVRLGRPSKKSLKSHTKGLRPGNKPGPKAGEAAILNWYKARMLTSPKSRRVLEVILDAALDNKHKNQAIAWKIITDRLLPLGSFDQGAGKGTTQIAITVNTVHAVAPKEEVVIETEFKEVVDESSE